MRLFDNANSEESFFFIWNVQMLLEASREFDTSATIQYLCTLLRGETLSQLDTLSVEVVIMIKTHLTWIILGLGKYFFHINALSKYRRTMRQVTRKPRKVKVRHYADNMIYLDEYLYTFPGGMSSDKIFDT